MAERARTTLIRRRGLLATAACLILAGPVLTGWLWTLPSAREAAIAAVLVVAPTFATIGFSIWQQFHSTTQQVDSLQDCEKYLTGAVRKEWLPWRARILGNDAAPAEITFYETLTRYRFLGSINPTRLTQVLRYYQESKPAALLILGAPGTGKTVLCIEFLFSLLRARKTDVEQPVPILLSLSDWHVGTPLITWICQQLTSIYSIPKNLGRSLVEEGRVIVILDGLEDALDPDNRQIDAAAGIESLKITIRGLLRSQLIVTCRDTESAVLNEINDSALFQVLHIDHLEPRQVARYLASRYRSISRKDSIEPAWETVHDRLISLHPGVLGQAFSTPWRLSLATTVVDGGQIAVAELLRFQSLKEFDDKLLARFIPASLALASSRRGTNPRFTAVQFKSWLGTLARYTPKDEKKAPASNKLVIHQLWPIAGRDRVQVLHGSVSVIGGALLGVNGAEFASGPTGLLSACIYAVVGVGLGIWAAIDRSPKPSHLSLQGLRSWKIISYCAIFAAAEGLLNSLVAGPAVGTTVGMLCLIVGVIVAGFRGGIGRTPRPNGKISDDLIFGVALGVAIGLASGLPGGFTGGLIGELGVINSIGYIPSVLVALIIGIICGVCIGARSWLRYKCASVIWAFRKILPFRLATFLREARVLDILRTSGGAYDFRHDMLRSWLADASSKGSNYGSRP